MNYQKAFYAMIILFLLRVGYASIQFYVNKERQEAYQVGTYEGILQLVQDQQRKGIYYINNGTAITPYNLNDICGQVGQ